MYILGFIFTFVQAAPVTLALNWKPEPQFGGFYQAEMDGIFKKNKLDIKIVPGGTNTPTVQLAASNKVPFAIVSADELILNRDRGGKLVALFAVYQTSPQGLMARKERNFKSIKDLLKSDSRVLWQIGLPYVQFLKAKYKPILAKESPYSGGIGFLIADAKNTQQIFVTSEPLLAKKANIEVDTFLIADEGFNPYNTVVVADRNYVAENKTQVNKFIESISAGWTKYLESPTAANAYMAKLNPGMDLETFAFSAKAQEPFIQSSKIGSMTEKRWSDLAQQMHDLGFTKTKVKTEDIIYSF
jgi:NitT/TauT family transport system substrate-binding protein